MPNHSRNVSSNDLIVEIDEKAELLARQLQIGEELLLMDR
jgi:hypothetical protein